MSRAPAPLADLDGLAAGLRSGLDARGAALVVAATRTLLGSEGAALLAGGAVLASTGTLPPVEELLERGEAETRGGGAGRYRVAGTDMLAHPLAPDGTPVAVLHIHLRRPRRRDAEDLARYCRLVSGFLELAELDASRRQAESAELRVLRAELSPHFLHNCLTAISGFIATDPEQAEDLLSTFAEFLRAGFRYRTDLSTLAQEIRLVEIYLELEQARFGDRFDVSLRVAPEVLGVEVPFLTLQPVVENAIRHGLEGRPGRGRLRIRLEDRGAEVHVAVEDDGLGTDPDSLQRALAGDGETRHLGILAVDERLRSMYGPAHGLVVATATGAGTLVTMRVPRHRRTAS
ncbi:MAG: sensor histidine kinase [Kineosporiaceae bacterium]